MRTSSPATSDHAVKTREGDQPLPTPNDSRSIQDMVIEDIEARKAVGLERYGTLLQANNGRDSLQDLYEELLDAATYARQLIEERRQLIEEWRLEHDGE